MSKDHDAVDVGLGEYVQKNATKPWLAAYRLLSKTAPCIPEVAIRMAQLSEMERSYSHVLLYPPQPRDMVEFEGRQVSLSSRMYGAYLMEQRLRTRAGMPMAESFLQWHRERHWDAEAQTVSFRGGARGHSHGATQVVACRYWYELTDGFWGQFCITQLPHGSARDILPQQYRYLDSMQNFVGMLEFCRRWVWSSEPGVIDVDGGMSFNADCLPYVVDSDGELRGVGVYDPPHSRVLERRGRL